jgi:hypothetical protein
VQPAVMIEQPATGFQVESVHSIWVSAILPSRAFLDPPLHQTAPRIGLTI